MNEGYKVNSYNKTSFISICKINELWWSNIDDVCKMEQIEFIDELLIRIGTDIIKKEEELYNIDDKYNR